MYLPISGTFQDASQQKRLMPSVGNYVEASGRVFEGAELKAIDIHVADEQK